MSLLQQQQDRSISSWTGFSILIQDDVTVIPGYVVYLPTINVPHSQVLNPSLSIMRSLDLMIMVSIILIMHCTQKVLRTHENTMPSFTIVIGK